MDNYFSTIISAVSAIVFVFFLVYMVDVTVDNANFLATIFPAREQREDIESFVKCLEEEEVELYGSKKDDLTFEQKELFEGVDIDGIYQECIEKESGELMFICQVNSIKKFPTWVFPSEDRMEDVLSLEELEEKVDCSLKNSNTGRFNEEYW